MSEPKSIALLLKWHEQLLVRLGNVLGCLGRQAKVNSAADHAEVTFVAHIYGASKREFCSEYGAGEATSDKVSIGKNVMLSRKFETLSADLLPSRQ